MRPEKMICKTSPGDTLRRMAGNLLVEDFERSNPAPYEGLR